MSGSSIISINLYQGYVGCTGEEKFCEEGRRPCDVFFSLELSFRCAPAACTKVGFNTHDQRTSDVSILMVPPEQVQTQAHVNTQMEALAHSKLSPAAS